MRALFFAALTVLLVLAVWYIVAIAVMAAGDGHDLTCGRNCYPPGVTVVVPLANGGD